MAYEHSLSLHSKMQFNEEISEFMGKDTEITKTQQPSLTSLYSHSSQRVPSKVIMTIIGSVLFEHLSESGLRSIMALYFKKMLDLKGYQITIAIHSFNFLKYFAVLVGGIIADSYLGKIKTIIFSQIIYSTGIVLLALSTIIKRAFPSRAVLVLAMLSNIIGLGGILPCLIPLAADQISESKEQTKVRRLFVFYFVTVQICDIASVLFVPMMKEIPCLGLETCYPLAFGVPATFSMISFALFMSVHKNCFSIPPRQPIVVQGIQCCFYALKMKIKKRKEPKRSNWLDYADDKYDLNFIEAVKCTFSVLCIPIPLYWSLYDQQFWLSNHFFCNVATSMQVRYFFNRVAPQLPYNAKESWEPLVSAIQVLNTYLTIGFGKYGIIGVLLNTEIMSALCYYDHSNCDPKAATRNASINKFVQRRLFFTNWLLYFFSILSVMATEMSTTWTIQASRMDTEVGPLRIVPDQVQALSSGLFLGFIPLIHHLYTSFKSIKIFKTLLRRMVVGGFLIAFAFLLAFVLELNIEHSRHHHKEHEGEIRIYNGLKADVNVTIWTKNISMKPLSFRNIVFNMKKIKKKQVEFRYKYNSTIMSRNIVIEQKQSLSFVISNPSPAKVYRINDSEEISDSSEFIKVRLVCSHLINCRNLTVSLSPNEWFLKKNRKRTISEITSNVLFNNIPPGKYKAMIDYSLNTSRSSKVVEPALYFKTGGIYTIMVHFNETIPGISLFVITPPNSVSILWMLPQYVILSISAVLFTISAYSFIYTETPDMFKSFSWTACFMTLSVGNMVTVIIGGTPLKPAYNFLLFSGVMFIGMFTFIYAAYKYKYSTYSWLQSKSRIFPIQ